MRLQKYLLVLNTLLCTSASILLSDRPSVAFNITPAQPGATSGYYRPGSSSVAPDNNQVEILTEIDTKLWSERLKRLALMVFGESIIPKLSLHGCAVIG